MHWVKIQGGRYSFHFVVFVTNGLSCLFYLFIFLLFFCLLKCIRLFAFQTYVNKYFWQITFSIPTRIWTQHFSHLIVLHWENVDCFGSGVFFFLPWIRIQGTKECSKYSYCCVHDHLEIQKGTTTILYPVYIKIREPDHPAIFWWDVWSWPGSGKSQTGSETLMLMSRWFIWRVYVCIYHVSRCLSLYTTIINV